MPRRSSLQVVLCILLTAPVHTRADTRPPHLKGRGRLHLVRGRFSAPGAAVSEVRRQGKSAGTAFLIKGGRTGEEAWVMTNHHVVWDSYNDRLSSYGRRPDLSLRFDLGGRSVEVHPTRYVKTSSTLDMAIMAFKVPKELKGVKPLPLLNRDVRAGEALCAIGYPYLRPRTDEVKGWWCDRLVRTPAFKNRPDSRWAPGLKILTLGREINGGRPAADGSLPRAPLIRHNVITMRGSSGSPILAREGVIGLESRGDPIGRNAKQPPPSNAVSMRSILDYLHRVAPDVHSALR